jgi:integrase
LSKEEVAKNLDSVDNIKHKAILMLAYSSGLRVGEVVKLKPEDIDGNRMLVFMRIRNPLDQMLEEKKSG